MHSNSNSLLDPRRRRRQVEMLLVDRRLTFEDFSDLTKKRRPIQTPVARIEIRENMVRWQDLLQLLFCGACAARRGRWS